jgi:hypothetical protein
MKMISMNDSNKNTVIWLAAFLLALLTTGCSRIQLREEWPWQKSDDTPTPTRILAIWSDTVLHTTGKVAVRGFGGRLFFYADDDADPIKVDGAVIVYTFDAGDQAQQDVAPEKKFVFTAEDLHKHYSRCSLGNSYSFWIPWDKVGGPTRHISLVVRFEGSSGAVVLSDPSQKLLPGVAQQLADAVSVESSKETVKQVVYDEPDETTQLDTQTINVPPSFSKRWRGARQTQHQTAEEMHQRALERLQVARNNAMSVNPTGAVATTQAAEATSPAAAAMYPVAGHAIPTTGSAPGRFPAPSAATARPTTSGFRPRRTREGWRFGQSQKVKSDNPAAP